MPIPQPGSIPPGVRLCGNDSPENFARLASEFLQAAHYTDEGFQHKPMWPTYALAFQALENHLKSYLLRHGATLKHVHRKIGHKLTTALTEAKAKGLVLAPSCQEESVMRVSEVYTNKDFQYRGVGHWQLVHTSDLIQFVHQVRTASGN